MPAFATAARAPFLRRHRLALFPVLAAFALALVVLGCALGDFEMSLGEALAGFAAGLGVGEPMGEAVMHEVIVWDLRLPRAILALAVGSCLAVAGASMQGLFRNPLADPGLIGVSAGAALGAALFIVFGAQLAVFSGLLGELALPGFAIAGSCAATFVIYSLSLVEGRSHVATLLLTGVAVNAMAGALLGFMIFSATDEQIRDFTFWTLGSLAGATWESLAVGVPLMLGITVLLCLFARGLNALLLGEAEAHHLGLNVQRLKQGLILLAASAVAVTVALCGIIGFVGLVVPHLVRLAMGPDHRYLLPASALLGAGLLLAADLLARNAIAYSELPVGVVTAGIGAPFFLYLLHQAKRSAAS